MRGGVQVDHCAGFEVAHVAADLQQVVRSNRDIRLDASENYFLILQEEGKAQMSQNETSCLLSPGDMVLIDSACTSDFTFFGDYNRQLSLHLPRAEMQARFGYDLIRGGISVPRHDPTNLALCAVLGKVFGQPSSNAASNTYLREAIFGLIGAMLHERSGQEGFAGIDSDLGGARAGLRAGLYQQPLSQPGSDHSGPRRRSRHVAASSTARLFGDRLDADKIPAGQAAGTCQARDRGSSRRAARRPDFFHRL